MEMKRPESATNSPPKKYDPIEDFNKGVLPHNEKELIAVMHYELDRLSSQLTLMARKVNILGGVIEIIRAKTDPEFAQRLEQAKAEGRTGPIEMTGSGPYKPPCSGCGSKTKKDN